METFIVKKGNFEPLKEKLKCISEYDELIKFLKIAGAPIIETPQCLKLNCSPEKASFWVKYADNLCMNELVNC